MAEKVVSSKRSRRRSVVEPIVRLVAATVIVGAVGGALIGGLGGRLAMRILFLTSDDSVEGLTSDDGFEIGRFTLSGTAGLVLFTALIGVMAALLYLVALPFVTRLGKAKVPAMAVFYGVIGGAMLVHTDGVDFNRLEPAALAIALFVGICAGFGALVARVMARAAAVGGWPQRRSGWLLGPPLLLLLFPPFLLVAVLGGLVHRADAVTSHDERWWQVAHVGVFVTMSGLFLLGAVNLASDIATLT